MLGNEAQGPTGDAYQPLPAYREDSADATRIWLAALHGSDGVEAEPCACGVVTKRHVVATVIGTPIREHAILLTRAQCDACARQWEIAQLRRSLYTSPFAKDLREDLRAGFEARLKELTKAVA